MKRHLAYVLLVAGAVFAAGCGSDEKRYSSDGIDESDRPTEVDPDAGDPAEDHEGSDE